MSFNLDVVYRGSIPIVIVRGDVDLDTAPILHACLSRLVSSGNHELAVDLSECSYIDSEGLKVLIGIFRLTGGRITITGAKGYLPRIFHLSGIDQLFRILPSINDLG